MQVSIKAKNKTIKVAKKIVVSDELPEAIIETYLNDAIRGKFSLNGATINKGKDLRDFKRGTTTLIISKFITRNPAKFRRILSKFV